MPIAATVNIASEWDVKTEEFVLFYSPDGVSFTFNLKVNKLCRGYMEVLIKEGKR